MSNYQDPLEALAGLYVGRETPGWYNAEAMLQTLARRVLYLERELRALKELAVWEDDASNG